MSDKKRVFFVTASFGCDATITCETMDEVVDIIKGEYDDGNSSNVGESITITIGEMTQEELDARTEFDGC